ncbi:uncharacterized protein PHACADRAFT_247149 [Phanerochaete carnosa HHB-10118-sp]|uniref:Phospholipid/glycerol acyltransferase domain-containing protein n=1 Tax=Phanerochaete carnosa (strain HHB-10118-sp) TaxID=650164 RepID=K5WNB3_PHACS|nr:uncharacterized protein PHACADRAFT_247149 [Phanerochaete carnosa HHB-10118-sp]EKM60925.1 hypothetical protein PHACADRAFT_247149 [Phanerochaete carnosa HHB-10118-sp]
MAAPTELHTLEISQRPRKTWAQTFNAVLFFLVFNLGCLMISGFQFACLLPLRLLPFPEAQKWYDEGIRYSKGACGTLLVLVTQLFAPASLVVSFERNGPGAFSREELDRLVVRDGSGRVTALQLPPKAVWIANHQMYADWWYVWCLTYFAGSYKDVFIVLKKSLKWLPIIGWGMQLYNFIFLSRSWASDRLHLAKSLSWLSAQAEKRDTPLTFVLYPEGTLVSKHTRPLSKKYADKMGFPDNRNMLLPRSTGLQYSLRALSPRIRSLQLIDVTVAYPGIPPLGYGQSYYTLRSIFMDGVPPPQVHMHVRKFDVSRDVPIGDLSKVNPSKLPNVSGGPMKESAETDVPQDEKDKFDKWLRELWTAKDHDVDRYLDCGSFVNDPSLRVEIPIAIRRKREILDAFCFFIPALLGWIFSRLK